jgi:hypothetical protein
MDAVLRRRTFDCLKPQSLYDFRSYENVTGAVTMKGTPGCRVDGGMKWPMTQ